MKTDKIFMQNFKNDSLNFIEIKNESENERGSIIFSYWSDMNQRYTKIEFDCEIYRINLNEKKRYCNEIINLWFLRQLPIKLNSDISFQVEFDCGKSNIRTSGYEKMIIYCVVDGKTFIVYSDYSLI